MATAGGSVSSDPTVQLFKKVYGEMRDVVPDDQKIANDIAWSDGSKVGDAFVEDVILGHEVGITLGGNGQEAFEIAPAVAGAVKQTTVQPYVTILPSIMPFATISRAQGGGEKAFYDATKFITKNNLKSHNDFQEIFRFYGQSDDLLGYVSYYSGTYRGQSLSSGTGTVGPTGSTITFTNGVSTAAKAILFEKGSFAAGHWVAKKGVRVKQVNASGVVVASGKLVTVVAKYGYIVVDFTPVAASSQYSHRLCFDRQEDAQEMIGMQKILSNTGTLFGIDTTKYELFKGNVVDLLQSKLNLGKAQDIIADAVNGGGLDGDVDLYVNPRTWAGMATTEAGLRIHGDGEVGGTARNGFTDLEFYSQTGKLTIKAHRKVKEGDAFGLVLPTWKRSGSAQVGFKVPGMGQGDDLIRPLENQAGYQFKSFADEYVFCWAPAQNIYIKGIDDEAAA